MRLLNNTIFSTDADVDNEENNQLDSENGLDEQDQDFDVEEEIENRENLSADGPVQDSFEQRKQVAKERAIKSRNRQPALGSYGNQTPKVAPQRNVNSMLANKAGGPGNAAGDGKGMGNGSSIGRLGTMGNMGGMPKMGGVSGAGSGMGNLKSGMGSAGSGKMGKLAGLGKSLAGGKEDKKKDQDKNAVDENGKQKKPGLRDFYNDAKNLVANQRAGGDPREATVDFLDKYAHIGKKIVLILWAIWYALGVLSAITSIAIIGIPSLIFTLIILHIFIVSPKTVYRITELILDLVGVGEYLQAMDEVGLDQVEMKATGWQKASIILLDILIFIGMSMMIGMVIKTGCDTYGYTQSGVVGSVTAGIKSTVADIASGQNGTGSFLQGVCDSLPPEMRGK